MLGKFYMMVGIPASGKSNTARQIANREVSVLLSSDEIRKELFGDESNQSDNAKVFEVMNKRACTLLANGVNVVYDATNTSRKKRIHLINNVIKASYYEAIFVSKDIKRCYVDDSFRDNVVGKDVINKIYKSMQIPIKGEGWDNVEYLIECNAYYRDEIEDFKLITKSKQLNHDLLFNFTSLIVNEFEKIKDLPHDSKHHSFSVSRHTFEAYKYVLDNYKGENIERMLLASLFHDIGKAFTKSFTNIKGEETKYAHFYGHEYVGSQITLRELYKLGYDMETVIYVSELVQLHMILHYAGAKQLNKLMNLVSEEMFNDLVFLNEADLQAH